MKKVDLHVKTKYSMDNESTIDIKNLILKCVENKEKGVAIIDNGNVVSFLKADKVLKELNISDFKLIYGITLNIKYNLNDYEIVILLKNKKGICSLYDFITKYKNKNLEFDYILKNKENLIVGLIYNKKIDNNLLHCFDYVEVNSSVDKNTINRLKKKALVIYSNQINALSDEELLAKKVLYSRLKKLEKINNRIYKNTKETLKEMNDKEIVIDNPNKIFNMIDKIDFIDNNLNLPINKDFDLDKKVYEELNNIYGNDIPNKILNRVKYELNLIHELNYEYFLDIYYKIVNECKKNNEEYVIEDYTNYLYINYLLGINHFDPIKRGLNPDMFFSNSPKISLKVSNEMYYNLFRFIKKDLSLKTIRCKSLIRIKGHTLNIIINDYEKKNNIKLNEEKIKTVIKYLDDYPVSNKFFTFKEFVLTPSINNITPYEEFINDENLCITYTNIDYKDIENNFMMIELLPNDDVSYLSCLKNITGNYLTKCNYKDKIITKNKNYLESLNKYENFLIIDDLYDDLIDNLGLPDIYNIINEIRKNKFISKNTKDILNKLNIKLRKYHNINYINRGIINERIRLIYELLYFKEYYKLEYYYTILKNNISNSIIEIIIKGYDEVIKRIKKYDVFRYEYSVLNILKDLYESDIVFKIEKRELVEDFCFEIDKENNQLTLVLNKKNLNKLSLIGTRPLNGKMEFLSKKIFDLLKDNKDILLFGLDGPSSYYVEYLLNNITGIDRKIIHKYLNPCSCYNDSILTIDKDKYIDGLNYLLNHNLTIKDYNHLRELTIYNTNTLLDKILSIIDSSDSKIIIIDNINIISNDLEKTLKNISKRSDIKFIIFNNLKREYEKTHKKDISSFENYKILDKYFDNIAILDKEKLYEVKNGNKSY